MKTEHLNSKYTLIKTRKPAYREKGGKLLRAWDVVEQGKPVASLYEVELKYGVRRAYLEDSGTKDEVSLKLALQNPFYLVNP